MDVPGVRRFYESHARIYDSTRRFLLPDRRRAVELLDVRTGDRVADFACGTGLNVPHLAERSPGSIVGVDCSPAMLERARKKHPRVEFVTGDVTTVRLDRPVERGICTYGLSMVDAWEDALRNMHRHLAPGGVLVLLDFHALGGALRPADPLFRWWLARFGVAPGRDLVRPLETLFERVDRVVRRSGYDVLVRASGPRA